MSLHIDKGAMNGASLLAEDRFTVVNLSNDDYTLFVDPDDLPKKKYTTCCRYVLYALALKVLAVVGILAYASLRGGGLFTSTPPDSSMTAELPFKDYLAQQRASRPRFREPPRSVFYPNMEILGRGYDVFVGDPRAPGVTSDPGIVAGSSIFAIGNENTPGVDILAAGERCSTSFESETVFGMSSYRNTLEGSVGVSAQAGLGMFGGSFSMSTSWGSVEAATTSRGSVLVESVAECSFYEASIVIPQRWSTGARAPLSRDFQDALDWLASLRTARRPDFDEIIDFFGTHAIFNNMRMGSLVGTRSEMTQESFLRFSQSSGGVRAAASVSAGFATFGTAASSSFETQQAEQFNSERTRVESFTIGTSPARQQWQTAARSNPSPIAFDLLDLSTIISTYSDHPHLESGMADALRRRCDTLQRRGEPVTCGDTIPDNIPVPDTPTRWRTCVRQTQSFGGGGGRVSVGLIHSTLMTAAQARITSLVAGADGGRGTGGIVNSLSFTAQLADGEFWFSGQATRSGRGQSISVPEGARITGVNVRSGIEVDALEFLFSDGSRSPYIGGLGGGSHSVRFTGRNARLIGFSARGDRRLDRVGFTWAYEVERGREC